MIELTLSPQAAHVGIGIEGREDRQAKTNSLRVCLYMFEG